MSHRTLHKIIQAFEEQGELIRINAYVDPHFEIPEITDRVSSQENGKALLFENTGYDFPVLTNMFGSYKRMNIIFQTDDFTQLSDTLEQQMARFLTPPASIKEKIQMFKSLTSVASCLPSSKKGKGACQQVVMPEPDVTRLPVLTCWPKDGGPFITFPVVHTIDPDTGVRNVGMYRMQVFSSNMTGMHWHIHKGGASHFEKYAKRNQKMPVVVTLGGDPLYSYVASAPLPENVDEYIAAGMLRRKSVKMVNCHTVNMKVPADVDFVLEGYIDPSESFAEEGPFGDHTGYYSSVDKYPLFHITCITHKKNPVYPATLVGVPPQEDRWMLRAAEKLSVPFIKNTILPELCDLQIPDVGIGHNIVIAAIHKSYPGHAEKVMHALWGVGQMVLNKMLIVVDKNADLTDYFSILRTIAGRKHPERYFHFSSGPLDVLDHAGRAHTYGGKLCVDVTHDPGSSPKAQDNHFDPYAFAAQYDWIATVDDQFLLWNIPLAVLFVKPTSIHTIMEQMVDSELSAYASIIVAGDQQASDLDLYHQLWLFSCNYDPGMDTYFVKTSADTLIFLDCTTKTRNEVAPEIAVSSANTIQTVDEKWNNLGLGPRIPSPSRLFL